MARKEVTGEEHATAGCEENMGSVKLEETRINPRGDEQFCFCLVCIFYFRRFSNSSFGGLTYDLKTDHWYWITC